MSKLTQQFRMLPDKAAPILLHATALAIGGIGVLLRGSSGSGKSDLALRLIDRGAVLVSDDCVLASPEAGHLRLSGPASISGMIEVRGVGIADAPVAGSVSAALGVDLAPADTYITGSWPEVVCGIVLPFIRLAAHEASAPIKVELAVKHLVTVPTQPSGSSCMEP